MVRKNKWVYEGIVKEVILKDGRQRRIPTATICIGDIVIEDVLVDSTTRGIFGVLEASVYDGFRARGVFEEEMATGDYIRLIDDVNRGREGTHFKSVDGVPAIIKPTSGVHMLNDGSPFGERYDRVGKTDVRVLGKNDEWNVYTGCYLGRGDINLLGSQFVYVPGSTLAINGQGITITLRKV